MNEILPLRHMIRLDHKPQLFNFRVAGLVMRNDHLLVHRSLTDSYWSLPGGRAEIGESSEDTILREIREELDVDARIERLLWTAENFFSDDRYDIHELGFYYLIHLEEDFPFHETEIVHRAVDGVDIEFRWMKAKATVLSENDLRPAFIAQRIETLPQHSEHIIVREGPRRHG
ncbi:DNA mismatch repair protein MutT [Rhizobium sp. Leaf311]|uniref:NUDIX hydrolase n=1 Tax=Rhizobium sp. Leaf311 TaxID=1736332 RepID=UPI000712758D|nr:NUDIX hydrolase [Rhizobium sp. Leaf311]KQQ61096.1 DNA mismatch repair protein MutT [Rhizobium sp. Leaf311]